MDLTCPRCGEPNDNDSIHDEVSERKAQGEKGQTYHSVLAEFRTKGCGIAFREIYGGGQCQRVNSLRTSAASVLFDLMGDDADGVASMMEDFEWACWNSHG